MLGLILAAPFILLILVGLWCSAVSVVRASKQRKRFRQEIAERRRAAEGWH